MAEVDVLIWTRYASSILRGVGSIAPESEPPIEALRATFAAPYVHAALESVEDSRAAHLDADVLANELNSVLLDEVAERVAAALGDIEHVFFKGVVTRRRLAALVPRRITTDVDVLVAKKSFRAAEDSLRRAGFERPRYHRPFLQHFASERILLDESLGLKLYVDLHRGVAPWPLAGSLAASTLRRRCRFDGIWAPDEHHQLLILAVHYIKEAAQLDVRDAMDALLFLESSTLSLSRLVDLADQLRCIGALHALMARVAYVAAPTARTVELERRIRERSVRASLIEATVAVGSPPPNLSTPEMQLRDAWRRAVCLEGPVHAGMALGYLTAKALADRAWLGIRSSR